MSRVIIHVIVINESRKFSFEISGGIAKSFPALFVNNRPKVPLIPNNQVVIVKLFYTLISL